MIPKPALLPTQGRCRTRKVEVQRWGGREATQAAGEVGRAAGTGRLGRASHGQAPPHDLNLLSTPAGRPGGRDGYSRAGPRQLAEAAGGLPHQVHGPAVGGQGEEHIVADLFVAQHLLLEERMRRAVTPCPSRLQPQGPWAPLDGEGGSLRGSAGAADPATGPAGGTAPPDDNCISLIISTQPVHESSESCPVASVSELTIWGQKNARSPGSIFLPIFLRRQGEAWAAITPPQPSGPGKGHLTLRGPGPSGWRCPGLEQTLETLTCWVTRHVANRLGLRVSVCRYRRLQLDSGSHRLPRGVWGRLGSPGRKAPVGNRASEAAAAVISLLGRGSGRHRCPSEAASASRGPRQRRTPALTLRGN